MRSANRLSCSSLFPTSTTRQSRSSAILDSLNQPSVAPLFDARRPNPMIFTIFGFCSEFAAMTGDAKTNDRVDVPSPWDTSTIAQPETAIPNRQPIRPNTFVWIKTESLLGITSTRPRATESPHFIEICHGVAAFTRGLLTLFDLTPRRRSIDDKRPGPGASSPLCRASPAKKYPSASQPPPPSRPICRFRRGCLPRRAATRFRDSQTDSKRARGHNKVAIVALLRRNHPGGASPKARPLRRQS